MDVVLPIAFFVDKKLLVVGFSSILDVGGIDLPNKE